MIRAVQLHTLGAITGKGNLTTNLMMDMKALRDYLMVGLETKEALQVIGLDVEVIQMLDFRVTGVGYLRIAQMNLHEDMMMQCQVKANGHPNMEK
mmetsp:Transcript_13083/g.24040  ORF Transcript_13083/g.24040 Transcript_13083/m.24040 type:complete len:95 (-) Transcript_13083:81-365(-)